MSLPSIMWLKGAASSAVIPSVTFNTTSSTFTGTTTRTYSSISIGTADPSRLVVVTIGGNGISSGATAVTVGGISATQAVGLANSAEVCSIWAAQVSSGTTANIVVTAAAGSNSEAIGSFSLYNLSSNTAFNTNSSTVTSSNAGITVTVNIPNNGIVIAVDSTDSASATTITTGQTLAYSNVLLSGCSGNADTAAAYAGNQSAQTPGSINFHHAVNFSNAIAAAASWN